MRDYLLVAVAWLALASGAAAAPRQHIVSFGKWMPVKLFLGPNEDKTLDIKIRSLYVDGRLREFATGDPHDITERMFVVRRAYRLNDWLPSDEGTAHKWKWQRGGWLLVDRDTGRVSQLNLPNFDAFYSLATWYRDYAAYCGVSDDGTKLYAVVAQLGRKKPVLNRELGPVKDADMPDAQCAAPEWQRQPARVTFNPAGGQKLTFNIRGHAADLAPVANDPGDEDKQ
ncbi:MAG: hypothetical protein LAO06_09330 [Acidobacteriia bacterium]|nr:hypothetical protein [Terriglobia bacterium]